MELSPEDIDLTFGVNTKSHWYTVKACLPGMQQAERGTIITIASVLGYLGCSNLSTYTASKAALLSFHQSLAAELSVTGWSQDIKTILVAPGQLDTPMFKGMRTPSNFLAPVVAPVELAKEVVRMVDSGWSGEVNLPLYTRTTALIPALPAGLQKIVKALSGMDRAAGAFAAGRRKEE